MDETIGLMNMNDHDLATSNAPQKGEFYVLSPDMRGGGPGHGVVLENEMSVPLPEHVSLDPNKSGLKDLKEKPRLRQGIPNRMPNDLDSSFRSYWLISEPLKNLFEAFDSSAFAFAECDFILLDGSMAPAHYLCEVVREIDAIDLEASTVRVLTEGYPKGKYYSMVGGAKLAFHKDLVGSAHVFRTPYAAKVFCDRAFRDELIKNGYGKSRKSLGVWLTDAADY